jgi:hypothetical protein
MCFTVLRATRLIEYVCFTMLRAIRLIEYMHIYYVPALPSYRMYAFLKKGSCASIIECMRFYSVPAHPSYRMDSWPPIPGPPNFSEMVGSQLYIKKSALSYINLPTSGSSVYWGPWATLWPYVCFTMLWAMRLIEYVCFTMLWASSLIEYVFFIML